jgi:hypothetical protein
MFGSRNGTEAWVEKYNVSGAKTGEVQLSGAVLTAWVDYVAGYDAAAGQIYMFSTNHGYNGRATVFKYNATTGAYIGSLYLGVSTSWSARSINVGTFDYGATKKIIVGYRESVAFRVHDATTGTEDTSQRFAVYGKTGNIGGLEWDGTQFWSHNQKSRRLVKHSTYSPASGVSTTIYYGHSWYDSAGTVHESSISARRTITAERRAKLTYTLPAYPAYVDADSVNAAIVYAAKSSTYPSNTEPALSTFKPQGTISSPTQTAPFDINLTTGLAPNGGTPFVAGTPARMNSTESGTPNILLIGDGTGNIGPLQFNAVGKVKFGAVGTQVSNVKYFKNSYSTITGGDIQIPHGLSVTPSFALARLDGSITFDCTVKSLDATNIVVTVYNTTTGVAVASGGSYSIAWIATTA